MYPIVASTIGAWSTPIDQAAVPSSRRPHDREHDRERIEPGDPSPGLGLAQRDHEVALRAIHDTPHHAVVIVAELRERFEVEHPLVPLTTDAEIDTGIFT